jgi:hypothetical protein
LSLLLLAGAGGKTYAGFFVFTTPVGAMTSGPVSAEADITVSAGQIQIVLKNLQANPNDVSQLISDLKITINPGSLAGSSLTAASATSINVAGNGTTSPGSNFTTVAGVGWVYTPSSTTDGLLDVLAGPGHAGPANLIIGPPGPGGVYTNANGSIAGNGPHNPFLNQTASFTITAPNVSAATIVSAVTFSFGTTAGVDIPGIVSAPEPATVLTLASGLPFGLLALRRRLRRRLGEWA